MDRWNIKQIRQQIKQQRAALPLAIQQQAALNIASTITKLQQFKQSQKIAAYITVNGEADPGPLITTIWREHKKCYLPLINATTHTLSFAEYNHDSVFTTNRYGIPELAEPKSIIKPEQLDLVIVPLVAFDKNCNRIGMGGGYYDRSFAFTKQQTKNRPTLIGIAYQMQHIADISPEPWDVALDFVVTETTTCRLGLGPTK